MADKEITTKDVDVRGCKFFRNGICASPINPKCKLCVEISEKMCYYKQLACKKQECERLKKELEVIHDDCKGCPTCNEALYNANLYAKDYRKLKQTLIEIKDYCNKYPQNSIGFKKYILQKISEVLDDRAKQQS